MKQLVHTGDSANISWYAEQGQQGEYVYAEVLRDDVQRGPNGLVRRPVPVYYVRLTLVTETGNRPAGKFAYAPARKPNPLVLGNRTITRLVREHLKTTGENTSEDSSFGYTGDGVIADND